VASKKPRRPTDAELEILNVLWAEGPSTVRDVHDKRGGRRNVGYTTVLKQLQIMTDKELVTRDESRRSHVYKPRHGQQPTQRRLVRDIIDRAFGGSLRQLVLEALASKKTSAKDLEEIRQMIDEAQAGKKGKGGKR